MFNTFDHQQSLDLINLAGSVPHDSSWPGRDAGPVHPASPSIITSWAAYFIIFDISQAGTCSRLGRLFQRIGMSRTTWAGCQWSLPPWGPTLVRKSLDCSHHLPALEATAAQPVSKQPTRLHELNVQALPVMKTNFCALPICPLHSLYIHIALLANCFWVTAGSNLVKIPSDIIRSSWIILHHHPFREFRFQHSLSKTTQTFPASCSVEAVSASEGATPVTFSVFAVEASAFGGCHSSAASRPRRKIATKLSSWMMAQRGAPQIMGSNEPAAAYQGVEIKAMPTIKATKTSLGSLEVAITVPARSFRGLIVASKEGIQRKMGNCKMCENVTVDGRNSDPEEQEKELCKRSHCFWRRYVPCRGADLCHIQFRSLTSARCHQTHQAHHQKVHKDRDVHWWDIAIQGIPCDGQNHQRDQTCQNSGANWSFRHLQIQAEAKGRQQLHQHAILENDDDTHLVVTQEHAQQKRQAAHKHWIQFSNSHHIFLRHGWAKSFLEDVQRNNAGGSHQCTIRSGHDGS